MMAVKNIFSKFLLVIALLLPAAVFAAPFDAGVRPSTDVNAGTETLLLLLTGIFSLLWTAFIAFAVIMFIWAGFQFLSAQGEPDGIEKAKKSLLWGSIGVAVGVVAFALPFIIRGWISPG